MKNFKNGENISTMKKLYLFQLELKTRYKSQKYQSRIRFIQISSFPLKLVLQLDTQLQEPISSANSLLNTRQSFHRHFNHFCNK